MELHVGHFPVKTVGQPGEQAGFGGRKINTGHANLGKSKLKGPLPDLPDQLRTVDLTTVERHPPIVETPVRALLWRSEDDTRAFAAQLAAHPVIGQAFIELHGDLGAGKTTLARHLLHALGVQGRVKSPTYTVVEPYEVPPGQAQDAPLQIWHFDFFRFNDPREWEDAGFRDIFAGPGLKLAEWPEKAAALLPRADLVIRIEAQSDESRKVTLLAHTPLGQELLA
jgi:tRNA threonylcarbamoyladenosine biosynthesis protein TsaE